MGQTPLLDLMGQTVFFNLYFWTRTVGFIILPSVLLVILNVLLIRGIRKAQKRKLRLLRSRQMELSMIILENCVPNMAREKRSEEAARQRDSNSTSLMLVAIVSLFLATYPINFSIYCFMSGSFRQTFKALFCTYVLLTYVFNIKIS
uniref:G_PROTEIN_RECEP_F1_2 domain-containing protein n=1 Tax=Heterorhabditis bacteriophora TaxID=37862 RepID=A0A1I7WWN3_HETBA